MLSDRITEVRDRIATACLRAGRSVDDVQLVAVTKNHSREVVQSAIEAGLRVFGENRVQEAAEKDQGLLDGIQLHLIGHLQSNKARFIPGIFSWVESIDSVRIAEALSRRLSGSGREDGSASSWSPNSTSGSMRSSETATRSTESIGGISNT